MVAGTADKLALILLRIIDVKCRIISQIISMTYLRTLPEKSVGYNNAAWLIREGVSPDTRDNVKYLDDEECAYVMQRYRELVDVEPVRVFEKPQCAVSYVLYSFSSGYLFVPMNNACSTACMCHSSTTNLHALPRQLSAKESFHGRNPLSSPL